MFSPIFLCGKYVTTLELDNEAINHEVLKRKDMKLDDAPGSTFQEDSFLPQTGECKRLIEEVDKVIQEKINPNFNTYNQWAHILEPKESTMIHTHEGQGVIPHLSWVYYSKTDPKCGNIVWMTTVHNKNIIMEEEPKEGMLIIFPNWMPHFTKKNNSKNTRISISGNSMPKDQKAIEAASKDPRGLFDIIGVLT
jgi:hypothetical protein